MAWRIRPTRSRIAHEPSAGHGRRAGGGWRRRSAGCGGFSLGEGLIASVVLATAVMAVASALSASHMQSQAMPEDVRMVQLAEQLIEEIAAQPLGDPDLAPPNDTVIAPNEPTRSQYDDVGDYNGYVDRSDNLRTADGQVIVGPADPLYTRTVAVEFRDSPGGPYSRWGDLALVRVRVDSTSGRSLQISRLVGRATWAR
jgi:hypothetical protein